MPGPLPTPVRWALPEPWEAAVIGELMGQAVDEPSAPQAGIESGGTTVVKRYVFGGRVVAMRRGEDLYFQSGDHLGSASVTLDEQGRWLADHRFWPYGETKRLDGASESYPTDRLFTGMLYRDTIGLYRMGARWIDPALGRWISADTLIPDPANPQSLNRYSWVLNNALNYVDPSGHAECVDDECNWVLHPISGEIIQQRPTTSPAIFPIAYDPSESYNEAAGLVDEFRSDAGPYSREFDPSSSLTQDIMLGSGARQFHSAWAQAGHPVPFEWKHEIDRREGGSYVVRCVRSMPAYVGAQIKLGLAAAGKGSSTPEGPIDAVDGTIGSLDVIRVKRVGGQWVKVEVHNSMNWDSGLRIPGGTKSLAVVQLPFTEVTVGELWTAVFGGTKETQQVFYWWERLPDSE